ncbi:hypothetical protein [Petroclostridium sp. X23]|uniref:hypothetical protein n=1 Tax=Petroclostridium sp. X23 TaxID=3045146 RepID=UPI0024ADBE1B|nr:hypothetical protein [Petroclostridium sp. X23]WHH59105.1 hypothetical protein QKW49_25520 [Petroclostridium sp. X23]
MKKRLVLYIMLVLMSLIFNTMLCGCSKKAEKPAPSESDEEKKKTPDVLKELESSIQDIMDELDKKEEEKEKAEITIESKTEIKQEEGQDKASNETKQETKQEVKQESPEDKKWESITKKVEKIHEQWNELQPEAVKGGTPTKVMDTFSNTLNTLTTYVESRDMQNTLFFANELYRNIPDFMEQYNEKVPPDIKRMAYFIRDAKYNGMINQWEKSVSSINNLKSHWAIVKAQGKKEQEKQVSQMDFSITELEKVVTQGNITLTRLKSDIALDNLKKLEESFNK